MLTDYGCHVILVFDGQPLPAKRVCFILSNIIFEYKYVHRNVNEMYIII